MGETKIIELDIPFLFEDKTPIYVCSKRQHASTWRTYKAKGYNIVSSWINLEGALDVEEVGRVWWPIWLAEASSAAFTIFYAKPGDTNHSSCLLEMGACLATGGQIIHVGVSDTMKTGNGEMADFTYHPRWRRVTDLELAFRIASSRILADQPLPVDFR